MIFEFKSKQPEVEVPMGTPIAGFHKNGERPLRVVLDFQDFVQLMGQGDPLTVYNYLSNVGRTLDRQGR